jgi:hypothetical protein
MRNLILVFSLAISSFLPATNYYVSSLKGNDNNNGTSPATPFQTIEKINSLTLSPGDSILFFCGNVFRGQLIIKQSGSQGKPIVVSSYGTGAAACIMGSKEITSAWSVYKGNIYKTSCDFRPWFVFENENWHTMARTPSKNDYFLIPTDYFLIPSSNNDLKGKSDITGSYVTISMRVSQPATGIVKQFNSTTGEFSIAKNNFGVPFSSGKLPDDCAFILSNKLQFLDNAREFYYDSTKQILYLETWNKLAPTGNIEGSVYDFGVQLPVEGQKFIVIRGIDFRHQKNAGIFLPTNNSNIRIDHCNFVNLPTSIICASYTNSSNLEVSFNLIRNAFKAGMILGNCDHAKITGNDIQGCSPLINMAEWMSTDTSVSATTESGIEISGTYCELKNNKIDSASQSGISISGKYNSVIQNEISNCCLRFYHCGGIYCYNSSNTEISQNIIHQILVRSEFEWASEPGIEGGIPPAGILLPSQNIKIKDSLQLTGNTIYNCDYGIFSTNLIDETIIEKNTFYNIFEQALEIKILNELKKNVMGKMKISGNYFYSLNAGQCAIELINDRDQLNPITDFISCDSNSYYFFGNTGLFRIASYSSATQVCDVTQWKNVGFDQHGYFFTETDLKNSSHAKRIGKNLVADSTCESITGWTSSPNSGVNFVKVSSATNNLFEGNCIKVDFTNHGGSNLESFACLLTDPGNNVTLAAGKTYMIKFEISASEQTELNFYFANPDNNSILSTGRKFKMTAGFKTFYAFEISVRTGGKAKLNFNGQFGNNFSVFIDNLQVYEVEKTDLEPADRFQLFPNASPEPMSMRVKIGGYTYPDGSEIPESFFIPPYSSVILRNDHAQSKKSTTDKAGGGKG